MELHYVVVNQNYSKKSDTWDVTVTDKDSYDRVVLADKGDDIEELYDSIENQSCLEILGEDCGYEEAKQLALDYADNNVVTQIVIVPYSIDNK